MKRKQYWVILLVAIAMSVSSCKKKANSEIRWKFVEGNRLSYNYQQESEIDIVADVQMMGIEPYEKTLEMESGGIFDFNPNADGTANLSVLLEEKKSMEGSDKQVLSGLASAMPMKVNRIKVDYGADGKIILDDKHKTDEYYSIQSMIDELFQLPETPTVKEGQTWETNLQFNAIKSKDSLEGSVTTTFVGWEVQNGVRFAKFKSEITIYGSEIEKTSVMNLNIDGKGEWTFCPEFGRLMSGEVNYEIKIKGEADISDSVDSYQPVKVTMDGKGTARSTIRPKF